ncbi:MAG: Mn-containing catalase, partial [Thermoleophilia bacterium]|nr:Mn-containing catalase [Thermoleophilia bacterium]
MQYFFQGWGARGPTTKYRDMLLNTATEEMGHIEMLVTAVCMNLEGAPSAVQDDVVTNPLVAARMGGMDPRHFISTGGGATPADANGVPFDGSHIYASGNLMADMYANVAAESIGRTLAARLYELTDDPGMKDMLSYLLARDTMHQNQWLAVIEELGVKPVPDDFPLEQENREFSYAFIQHSSNPIPDTARWASGTSIDGLGEFRVQPAVALGEEPKLQPAPLATHDGMVATAGGVDDSDKPGVLKQAMDAVKG